MSVNYIKWSDVEAILDRIETIMGHAASLNCRGCGRMREMVHSEIANVKARHRLLAVDPEDSVNRIRLNRKKEAGFY